MGAFRRSYFLLVIHFLHSRLRDHTLRTSTLDAGLCLRDKLLIEPASLVLSLELPQVGLSKGSHSTLFLFSLSHYLKLSLFLLLELTSALVFQKLVSKQLFKAHRSPGVSFVPRLFIFQKIIHLNRRLFPVLLLLLLYDFLKSLLVLLG